MRLTLSLAQMSIRLGDIHANTARGTKLAQDAKARGSALLLLPEMWATGFHPRLPSRKKATGGKEAAVSMAELAKSLRLAVGGSYLEHSGGKYHNTFALFDRRGDRIAVYRKIHLFSGMQEPTFLTPGRRYVTANAAWGKTGMAICYDLRFPEMFRHAALNGARLFLIPANWPETRQAHWDVLLQARAIENQAFVAGCNRIGAEGGLRFAGGSAVFDPLGRCIGRAGDGEELLTVDIDLREAERVRATFPTLEDARRARRRGLA